MKTIVMDTSNAYLVIGLYEDDQCIDKYQADGNRRKSVFYRKPQQKRSFQRKKIWYGLCPIGHWEKRMG